MDATVLEDAAGSDAFDVEQYRDFVVDGEIYQALDLSRRLLQLDGDRARRHDAAQLLVERLRSNREDSSDHANALLRVLANYATPTKELTEELLALLFFCEHRVQIIHHLSKLTYQSRDCVWLVVDAYIELLSSDRSLLVPILGSLADLPLVAADKSLIIDATENLLDAASEEDVPAVVQSLLSMLVPAAASRIVVKIRSQCNRLVKTKTLSITFEVILRHAVAGSGVLAAFMRMIRQTDVLSPFDVVLLALLLARPSENGAAVRVVTALTAKGALTRALIRETLQRLHDQRWRDAYPSFIRLASALLNACFNLYRTSAVTTSVKSAVDLLGYLIIYRTPAQEEALSLMMAMVSQPQRLLLSTSKKRFLAAAHALCWDVAHAVASQLAQVASTHPTTLSPFAHVFLDHLYGIAASATQSFDHTGTEGASLPYPATILQTLCRTMVLLTKHEPGVVSLVMITIQKQLVIPVGNSLSPFSFIRRNQVVTPGRVKQLTAIFLAGEMLIQGAGETADRSSVLNWIQKLLTSTDLCDETTTHVVRLLGSPQIRMKLSSFERDTISSLLDSLFVRHSFVVKKHNIVDARFHSPSASAQASEVDFLSGLSDQSSGWIASSLVFDVIAFVRRAKLGDIPVGWHSHSEDGSGFNEKSLATSVRAKISLLSGLTEAFLTASATASTEPDPNDDKALVCSFVLPTVNEHTFREQGIASTIWCYACALQVAVLTTNALAAKQNDKASDTKMGAKNMNEIVRQRKRLINRVQTCWTLHKRLTALLEEVSSRLQQATTRDTQDKHPLPTWLRLQVDIIGKQFADDGVQGDSFSSSLCSLGERLSLQVVSAVFEGLWKQQSTMVESGLEIELFRAFPARLIAQDDIESDQTSRLSSIQALVNTQDGKRTLKYLVRRLLDYSEQLRSLVDTGEGDSVDDQESDVSNTRDWVLAGIKVLCNGLQLVIDACRRRQLVAIPSSQSKDDDSWDGMAIKLLAKGASDVRIRCAGSGCREATEWSTNCEIIFKSLASSALQATDGEVACHVTDVLLSLAAQTRMTTQLGRMSLALLHCPFPSMQKLTALSAPKLVKHLPGTDPVASSTLSNLMRPVPRKYHHLVYFMVGAWLTPTLRVGLMHLSYIVDCINALVRSTVRVDGQGARSKTKRSRKSAQNLATADKEPDAEGEIDSWIARDGEHRILKNLTHDTLPVFLETAIACLTIASIRAVPSSSTEQQRGDANPFANLAGVFGLVTKCFQLFAQAETSGMHLPQRTSLSILRNGPVILKNVEQALRASVQWREEGSSATNSTQVSDIQHLRRLVEAARGIVTAAEDVAASFQERVVLTMQSNIQTPVVGTEKDAEGKRESSGRWSNDLLRKTYRKQFQRRKPLSKSEAKLLPYFTHSAQQLKAYITDTCMTYRFDVDGEQLADTLVRSLQPFTLDDDQMEAVLALLSPKHGELDACDIAPCDDLVRNWSRLSHTDDDDRSVSGSLTSENDEDESWSMDEDEGDTLADVERSSSKSGFYRTPITGLNAGVNTLIPQKKRIKSK